MSRRSGFTLVEILIAVGIISILAAILIPSMNAGSAQSRDAERKADLRTLQGALELYKQEYGRYPEGCNVSASDSGVEAAWIGGSGYISGQQGTDYECSDGSAQYILNLAPQFIPVLPTDPRLNGVNSGYVYITNPAGTVYKVMALNTVETETVFSGQETGSPSVHPFARCGDMTLTTYNCAQVPNSPSGGGTGYLLNSGDATPAQCSTGGGYDNDFAVFGGFAPGGGQLYRDLPKAREYYTDRIHCW